MPRVHPVLLLVALALPAPAVLGQEVTEAPAVFLGGVPFSLTLSGIEAGQAEYRITDASGGLLGEIASPGSRLPWSCRPAFRFPGGGSLSRVRHRIHP